MRHLVLITAVAATVAVYVWGYHTGRGHAMASLSLANPYGFWEEARPFHERFDSDGHASIGYEEWIVRDALNDRRDGVFLDVGAADPRHGSNTYYLERELGWSGVAVDAIGQYAGGYRQFRPRTRFVSAFVSDVSDAELEFHVLPGRPYSSSADRRFAEYWRNGQPLDSRRVRTVALNDLLRHMNVTRIDLLSMDIELHEPKALAGFDLARYRPQLACIEAHPSTRQWILDYFQRHGYRLLGRYLRLDAYNLWFAPM